MLTWADREQVLKKEVNFRRSKWVEDSEAALNNACPKWLMRWLGRKRRVTRSQLLFVKVVLRLYGLEKVDVEKPGVGGICVITKRGEVVAKVTYEWPQEEDIYSRPSAQPINEDGVKYEYDITAGEGQGQGDAGKPQGAGDGSP